MNETQAAVEELSALLREIALPGAFLARYDPLECLSHGHGTETYLVRQKGAKGLCVAKCFDRRIYRAISENGILKSLRHKGLPAFLDEYQDDAAVWVVREYIEGTALDQYAAAHSMSEARIIALCVELCDILIYLHGQTPPVIHRDVKPQNIIVRDDGHIALIDFDIARTYDSEAATDTQFIATRTYAPPEQYGFSQTDSRADIYSLGVLLCFLLSGKTGVTNTEIPNKRLMAIVRRCTAFSPEARFPNAAAVKAALLRADGRRRKKLAARCFPAALALICLCAGFGIGRYTGFLSRTAKTQFTEPVMEQAVRVQLGKGQTEPITAEELLAVRTLYIFGNNAAKTDEAFSDGLVGPFADAPRGTLNTLEDVALLPNLETLYINYQTLADISPLSQLPYLTDVNLRHTFVEDVSPLAGMPHLRSVILFDTRVWDVSCLASCPALRALDVGQTRITSLDALPDAVSLESLSLAKLPITSIAGIERFAALQSLSLHNTGVVDLSPLQKLPSLLTVSMDMTMRDAAEALGDTAFDFLYQ